MSPQPNDPRPARVGTFSQLARLGLGALVPVSAWRRDRPWTIPSVQWFLFFTLFPLVLVGWTAVTGSEFGNVAYLYAIYFAMTWGLVIWLFVRPERIGILDIVRVSLFTSVMGVFIVGILSRLRRKIQRMGIAFTASSETPTPKMKPATR